MDGAVLGRNDPINEIADRNDAQDLIVGEDGQMANAMVGHETHAFFDGMRGADGYDFAGDDFSHRRLFGGFAFERDLPRVIAFGHDAQQPAMLRDKQSADIFVGHQLDCVEYHCVRRDGPDVPCLLG